MDIKIGKKQILAIVVLIVIGVIVGVIWYLFSTNVDDKNIPAGGIPISFGSNETRDVVFTNIDIVNEQREAKVYKLSQISSEQQVRKFMESSSVAHYSYQQIGSQHLWGSSNVVSADIVMLDDYTDELVFATQAPIHIPGVSRGVGDLKAAESLALEILAFFWDDSEEYKVRSSKGLEGSYAIYLSRVVDGLNMESQVLGNFSDELVLDSSGQIVSGSIYISKFLDPVTLSVVEYSDLGGYLDLDGYPYEYLVDMPIGYYSNTDKLAEGEYADIIYDEEPSLDQYFDENFEIPNNPQDVASCDVQYGELGYYITDYNQEYLVPTYNMYCVGKKIIEGVEFDVPVYVHINAINPDFMAAP